MIVIIGSLIVIGSVVGGFIMAGGNTMALLHLSELIIIGGAAFGALVLMSPKQVLIDLFKQMVGTLKGTPYNSNAYNELFKALYELFMLGRRGGMVALEEHIMAPANSAIFSKYPAFQKNKHAMDFLCNGLRPIIDGKIKPDHLKLLLEIELQAMEQEHERPIGVLTKAADAMPGFGIVAAVLVGTFLGIFISYGFMNPLAVNMEFMSIAELAYVRCIAASVISFASGMSPIMAIEVARRGLFSEVKPSAEGLETMLKGLNQAVVK